MDTTASPPAETAPNVFTSNDVEPFLRRHRAYLEGLPDGERACFENKHLQGITFRESLARAQFHRARLDGCSFEGGVDLTEADFSGADLRRVDFTGTENLAEHRLGASYLAYAKLPKTLEFTGLQKVRELAERAEKILFALLASCAAIFILTLLGRDEDLVRQTGAIALPVLSMPVPIRAFYFLAPLILLIPQFYLSATVLRLWTGLRDLPAVMPNNRFVYREVPSFPNFCVMPFGTWWPVFPIPGDEDSKQSVAELTRRERALVTVLVWWLVPATLAWIWLMYLPSHDWTGTAVQTGAVMLSAYLSVRSYAESVACLKRGLRPRPKPEAEPSQPGPKQLRVRVQKLVSDVRRDISTGDFVVTRPRSSSESVPGVDTLPPKVRHGTVLWVPASAGLAVAAVSLSAITSEGGCGGDLSRFSESRGMCYWLAADLQDAKLDSLPLRHRNLRRAFLQEARLEKTDLEEARLEGALFSGAKMSHANLKDSHLEGAIFWETDLHGARLKEAHLEGADLRGADLSGARLQGAHLAGADLRGANLDGAILCGADLGIPATPSRARLAADSVAQFRSTLRAGSTWSDSPGTGSPSNRAEAAGLKALTKEERQEYRRWRSAQTAVESLARKLGFAAGRRILHRDSLIRHVRAIDVSMGPSTQRKQLSLLATLEAVPAVPGVPGYVDYAWVAPGLQGFVGAVQTKAANHCVALSLLRLPSPPYLFDLEPSFGVGKTGTGVRSPT